MRLLLTTRSIILGIVIFSQPLPLPLWNNQQILFYFGLYSGLTNQRITLLNAAFFARMTGLKIILPQWKFDFSDYIGFSIILIFFFFINNCVNFNLIF